MKYKNVFLLLAFVPLFLMAQTKDYNYYYFSGNDLLQKGNWKEALSMFDSALLFQPKSSNAYIGRGGAKVYSDLFEEGLKDYDTAILYAEKKDKLSFYRKKENALESEKLRNYYYFDQKLAIYNEAMAAFPDSASAYSDRSFLYYFKGKYEEALDDAKKSMKICHTVDGYSILALAMAKTGDYSEKRIRSEYDKCIEEFPNDAASYFNRGVYFDGKRKSLMKNHPNSEQNKEMLDLQEKSLLDFSKAVSLNPNESIYQSFYCRLKVNSNKFSSDEILKDYQSWIDHCPTSRQPYSERAMYYASLKRWEDAIVDIDSSTKDIKSPLAILYKANFKDLSGNYTPEDILKDLDKAAALKAEKGFVVFNDEMYKRLKAKYGK